MTTESKTRLCPVLDYDRFEQIFGNVSESWLNISRGNAVLKWYGETGKNKLKQLKWDDKIIKRLKLTRPGDMADLDEICRFENAFENFTDRDWLNAARLIIKDDIGSDMFEFAGLGSKKVCLYSADGKAVKFSRDSSSLKTEITNNLNFSGYLCIPKMFDYDKEDMTSYICEFARESVEDDFKTIYGVENANDFMDCVRGYSRFPKKLSKALTAGIKQMRDMVTELRLIDVDGENNFGLIVRNGVRQIIIIDYDL